MGSESRAGNGQTLLLGGTAAEAQAADTNVSPFEAVPRDTDEVANLDFAVNYYLRCKIYENLTVTTGRSA